MQPTDKRIATVEQWQALKGVIDGNIGKARELTTDDYNWPTTGTPNSIALWLLEDGMYSYNNLTVRYNPNQSSTDSGQAIIKKATVSSGTGDGQVLLMSNDTGARFVRQINVNGTGSTTTIVPMLENNLTTLASGRALDARQGKVLKDLIDTETTDRQTADTNLQTQIDAISAGSDVTDIVGTKADLNNYDTTTLGNNDIIKVLADESESGATTYYRWSTTTSTFSLIGEEGPYYTKTQADALLADKQDALTAGANVTISNNTISATDTTYTAGTGIDITNGVISTTGGGGPTVVQAPGTSTTDVMSQNATTSMIFADPTTQKRVKIGAAVSGSDGSVVIGANAKGGGLSNADVVIGADAFANNGNRNIVIGASAQTSSNSSHSIAIGASAKVDSAVRGAIALGPGAHATVSGAVDIGASLMTDRGYNNTVYRLLTGIYDGQNDHDAVTVGQMNTAIAAAGGAEEISAADWSALWQ